MHPCHHFNKWIFISLFVLLVEHGALAEFYSYADRPKVSKVNEKVHSNPPAKWEDLKNAMVGFIAELTSLYPNGEYYFLARDSEYIYDMAKTLTSEDGQLNKRFHLLNVSRKNMSDPLMPQYLDQEGMNAKDLNGRKVVLIDTGWAGKIPGEINRVLPKGIKVVTHFAHSNSNAIPSSRVFLESLVSSVNVQNPSVHHNDVVQFEHLPHFSEISTQFQKIGGKIVPGSLVPSPNEKDAERLIQDVKAFGKDPKNRKRFERLREDMGDLVKLSRGELSMSAQEVADTIRRLDVNKAYHFLDDLEDAAGKNLRKPDDTFRKITKQALQLQGSAADRTDNVENKKNNKKSTKPSTPNKIALKGVHKNVLSTGDVIDGGKLGLMTILKVEKDDKGSSLLLENQKGEQFNLVINKDANVIKEIKKDFKKLDEINVPAANILDSDSQYILKEVTNGERGDEWLKSWNKNGMDQNDTGFKALVNLLASLSKDKIYLGNLGRKDMVWNGRRWVVQNVGYIKNNKDSSATARKFLDRFTSRWGQELGMALESAFKSCARLLSKVGG